MDDEPTARPGPAAAKRMSPLRRALRRLARPARTFGGRGGPVIQAYRGCGSREEVLVMGRVLREPTGLGRRASPLRRDLVDMVRRLLRRGVRDAVLEARFAGAVERVVADRDGYFVVRLRPREPLPADRVWHRMRLKLVEPGVPVEREAAVFVPPTDARFVVISDIDDTVMRTGVGNTLVMLWRLFVEGARGRVAFPGVAAFYGALHRGRSGRERNPMLYVSRGPWSLYEVLEAFFQLHRIPEGPVLFLREWGLTLQRPLPRRAKDHKDELIRMIMEVYRAFPVVLIGDSGQRDPEIYADVVRRNPGQVIAVYIRNVSRGRRGAAIETLARRLGPEFPLVLASDSYVMARHAAATGLISPEALEAVLAEKAEDAAAAD